MNNTRRLEFLGRQLAERSRRVMCSKTAQVLSKGIPKSPMRTDCVAWFEKQWDQLDAMADEIIVEHGLVHGCPPVPHIPPQLRLSP